MIVQQDKWIAELRADIGQRMIDWTVGGYISTAGSAGDSVNVSTVSTMVSYMYAVADCAEGDRFTVTATGGQSPRLWCFIDSNGKIITNAGENAVGDGLVVTAPTGATKAIFNANVASGGNVMLYSGRLPEQLVTPANDGIYRYFLSPLERTVFCGERRGLLVGSTSNFRLADVSRNYIYSKGRPGLTGTTFRMVVLTRETPITTVVNTDSSFVWYKDFFQPITLNLTNKYLYLRLNRFLDLAGASAGVDIVVATYNTSNQVYAQTLSIGDAGYLDNWYKLDSSIVTNGNIAILVKFKNGKQTFESKFNLALLSYQLTDASTFPAIADTGKTAQDRTE